MKTVLFVGALLGLLGTAQAAQAPRLKTLYDQHRWFELREAIKGHQVPALYKGAVAAAFNNSRAAEALLGEVVKENPNSDDAKAAHEMLFNVYARSGSYKDALHELEGMLRMEASRSDVQNVRPLFAAWSKHPDQSIPTPIPTTVRAEVRNNGVRLSVSIHGKTVHWLLDTGFNFSMMSESEAQRLGVAVDTTSSKVSDTAGGTTVMRTAVVSERRHLRSESQHPLNRGPRQRL